MTRHCIAVGVDAYPNTDWQLGACAADAIAFADWAVSTGGVSINNLRLLIAPQGGAPNHVDLPLSGMRADNRDPSRAGIFNLLFEEIRHQNWSAGDRLYFYFAGHGCSHETVRGARPEPVLFPRDVTALPQDAHMLIGFEEIMSLLRANGPRNQLIFIDACRDFALPDYVTTAGASTGRYLRPVLDDTDCCQNILYASAPGERSVELGTGHGIFSKALIDGLNGHPRALQRLAGKIDYQLTFARLAAYVRGTVETRLKRALLPTSARFVQTPQMDADAQQPEFEIATIPATAVADQPIFVRVSPIDGAGYVELFYENKKLAPPHGPPLKTTHEIHLPPAYYGIRARAPGLESDKLSITVPYDGVIDLQLKPAMAHVTPDSLSFVSDDESMPIIAFDPSNRPHTALGTLYFHDPEQGLYRAALVSPDRPLELEPFSFPACGDMIRLVAAPPSLTDTTAAAIRELGMKPNEASVSPSEALGPQAEFRLTSLLAFSAYATYSAPDHAMRKLRALDLDTIGDVPDQPWMTILVCATGHQPAKDMGLADWLSGIRISASEEIYGREALPLRGLAKLPGAAQYTARCPAGSFSIELSLPGIPPTRFAMNGMKERVSTLVVGVGDDQALEVQQYLFRRGGGEMSEEELPLLDKAQRFFIAAQPVPAEIVDRLLNAKMTDPLAACLAGYALVREGRRDRFRGSYDSGSDKWNPDSALQNMLSRFGGLPDAHILAGLCDPDQRQEHFARALESGLPIFADGFRALIDYFGKDLDQFPSEFDRARRTLSIGTAYSSWLSREPELLVRDGRFDSPPVQWRTIELQRERIEQQLAGCGLVIVTVDGKSVAGSGFVVLPDVVITADHVVRSALTKHGKIKRNARIIFTTTESVDAAAPGTEDGPSVKNIHFDPESGHAVLVLEEGSHPEDVLLVSSTGRADPGDPIYVLGYGLDAQAGRLRKHVWPGFILASINNGANFDHDGSTGPGSSGSPVLDAATGEVIGLHWSMKFELRYKRNRAIRFLRNARNRISDRISDD